MADLELLYSVLHSKIWWYKNVSLTGVILSDLHRAEENTYEVNAITSPLIDEDIEAQCLPFLYFIQVSNGTCVSFVVFVPNGFVTTVYFVVYFEVKYCYPS